MTRQKRREREEVAQNERLKEIKKKGEQRERERERAEIIQIERLTWSVTSKMKQDSNLWLS